MIEIGRDRRPGKEMMEIGRDRRPGKEMIDIDALTTKLEDLVI